MIKDQYLYIKTSKKISPAAGDLPGRLFKQRAASGGPLRGGLNARKIVHVCIFFILKIIHVFGLPAGQPGVFDISEIKMNHYCLQPI